MLHREIIAVCSEIHTEHINMMRGQNVEFFNVTSGGIYSDHWALKVFSCVCPLRKTRRGLTSSAKFDQNNLDSN
jgi:hypothetical protein